MGREGGHLGGLKNTVFFLQIGLEALLSLGPDSRLLLNTNRKQQDSKGHKFSACFFSPFL